MKSKLTKLFTLLVVLLLGFGQMWGATTATVGTYDTAKPSTGGKSVDMSGGSGTVFVYRPKTGGNSSFNTSAPIGINTKSNANGVAFYISSSMKFYATINYKNESKNKTCDVKVYQITEALLTAIAGATSSALGSDPSDLTSTELTAYKKSVSYTSGAAAGSVNTEEVTLPAGYYYVLATESDGNSMYWGSITLSASCSTEITTQPSGATLAVGDANPTLSVVATNAASYAWKESSDGTSYDGASTLASTASFTPEVNDAVQTKYYYCEVTSDCDGTTVVKSNIVTVNVVGAITYYTVTLVPAGGVISDATGWTPDGDNYTKTVADGTELTLPTFTKADRNFKTWRKAGPADVASPVTVDGDLTLTAIWTATVEQVIYSWEGAEGGAIETGGTVTGSADKLINQTSAGYYCLKIDGKADWSTNYITITLTGTEKVKTGDKIKYWGFYNKSSNANARPKMRDANSPNTEIFNDGTNLPNLNGGGEPAERTFTVPASINTNAVQITRSQTGSNTWISKLQIIREVQVEEGDLLTVTFDANGGSAIAPVVVASGQAVAKPADPTWAHHRFNEWQLAGSAYDFSSAVNTDITLVANWTQLYTISFANGGGSGDAPAAIADKAKDETFEVPANTFTAPASKEFDIWNDGTNDYAPGATYTVGTENVILTAQWKALVAKYTVIFKDGETTLDTKLVDVGSNPSDAGVDKTKALSTFAAWQKDAADIALDDAFWATVAANAEITLTARWTKAYASNADFEAYILANTGEAGDADKAEAYVKSLNYALSTKTNTTFDANDETNNGAYAGLKIKNAGTVLSWNVVAEKVVELKAGVMVANGSLAINGGAATTIDGGSITAGNDNFKIHYFYSAAEALYEFTTSNGSAEVIKAITMRDPFTVSFEAHGDADPSALQGLPSVTLPDATNGTASLLGWFDAETGGNKIGNAGATYIPTANITLHAQWESVSSDNTLSDLKVGGVTVDGFDPAVHTYYVVLPYGTAVGDIPAISATANSAKAKQVAIEQAVWTGDPYNCYRAQANVQAEDESWGYYDVRFSFAPKDGASIFKAELTSATTATYSGIYADADNSQIKLADDGANGYKFSGTSNFIKMALDGGTFATGDLLTMTYSKDPQQGELAIYENTTKIVGTSFANHTLEFTAGADGLTELFIRRTSDNNFNGWVSVVEVTRVVNPMLTAITFAGEAGTINESLKTVTVTVPNATDLGSMTVVPTIVRNAPHATTPEAVITNAGAWVEGPNTYRIMDKDGDYTDYTVTITRAALSDDATLSELTYGGTAIALADGVFEYNVELPYGTSVVPALAATAHHVSATIKEISDAAGFVNRHATSTVTVKAEDNSEQVYTVNFEVSRFESKLIWDGSTMSALSDITAAATAAGVAVTTTGISVTSFSAKTCADNGKSYTKALDFGGSTKATRQFSITIPDGNVARISLVCNAKGTGARSISVGTDLAGVIDENAVSSIETADNTNLFAVAFDFFAAGTLFINTTDGFQVHEITIQMAPGYGRSAMLGNGVLGTVCVPNNVAIEDIQGATFFELMGREPEHGKLAFDEITSGELEAGAPYVFQAQGNHIALLYGATSVGAPVDKGNGMYGTFSNITLTELDDVYYFAQKALWGCSDLTSLSVPANRAYVKLSEIDYLSALAPAPGRRRILMGVNGENQATGLEDVEGNESIVRKVVIDGTLYILRGEKIYDTTGRLVK